MLKMHSIIYFLGEVYIFFLFLIISKVVTFLGDRSLIYAIYIDSLAFCALYNLRITLGMYTSHGYM